MENVGERITYYRKIRNYTRKELVEGICDDSTLYRIEKGNHLPSLYIVDELCKKLNIPISALFENEQKTSISSLKQQCRRHVYTQDYTSLSKVLKELDNEMNSGKNYTYEDKLFVQWHEAIVLHKLYDNSIKSKEVLLEIVPEKPVLEVELSALNTMGLICFSMDQKEDAGHYFEVAFKYINFESEFNDPTLPIRVAYNHASQLYYQYKYHKLIETLDSTLEYLKVNYLFYMKGRLYYLLGKAYEKLNWVEAAKEQFQLALEIFKSENRESFVEKEIALLKENGVI